MKDAGSGAAMARWTLTLAALGKATCQFLDLRLEREQCHVRLREIAVGGFFNCVAIPALLGVRIKVPQIPLNFRKICAAELLLAAQLSSMNVNQPEKFFPPADRNLLRQLVTRRIRTN
jgi:hypothetical protein